MVAIHRISRAPPTVTITDRDERFEPHHSAPRRDPLLLPTMTVEAVLLLPSPSLLVRRLSRLFRTGTGTPELLLEGVWW